MKNYWALRFIATVLTILGWLTIVFGLFALFIFIIGGHQTSGMGVGTSLATVIAYSIFAWIIISGVVFVAAGEVIKAFIEIAKNCTSLPLIEDNTHRMVEFFELMAKRGDQRA
jgi:hypothetical protein